MRKIHREKKYSGQIFHLSVFEPFWKPQNKILLSPSD